MPDDETVRNNLVSALEDKIAPMVQQNLACFREANDMSFDLLNEWIELVGEDSGLAHISSGSGIIAEQVADVLENEAAGCASSANEIVETIAEVVAENILNPGLLIDQLNCSSLLNESMPSCGLANVSIPHHDDLMYEQMPAEMLMLDQSMSCANRSNQQSSHNESLESQLQELETLLAHERAQGACNAPPAAASIVVNESKTMSTLQRNSCGEIVPTTLAGTVTTTTTTIEPVDECAVPERSFHPVQLDVSAVRNRSCQMGDMSFLGDVEEPEGLNSFQCEMRGDVMPNIDPSDLAEFRETIRQNISQVLNASLTRNGECANPAAVEEVRAELEAQLASIPISFPQVGDTSNLFDEEADFCDNVDELPESVRHLGGDVLFQEVPSDDRAMRITTQYIMDQLQNTDRASCMVDQRNYYDRRLMLVIETRMEGAIRNARGLFGAEYGSCDFPMQKFIEYIKYAVLDEIRSLRFEQLQNQRAARGEAPLVEFGPRNWTQDDVYGPHPEHMSCHVYDEEPLPQYGPELMYGPWLEQDYVNENVPQQCMAPPKSKGAIPKVRSSTRAVSSSSSRLAAPSTSRAGASSSSRAGPSSPSRAGASSSSRAGAPSTSRAVKPSTSRQLPKPSSSTARGTTASRTAVPKITVTKTTTTTTRAPAASGIGRPASSSASRPAASSISRPSTSTSRISGGRATGTSAGRTPSKTLKAPSKTLKAPSSNSQQPTASGSGQKPSAERCVRAVGVPGEDRSGVASGINSHLAHLAQPSSSTTRGSLAAPRASAIGRPAAASTNNSRAPTATGSGPVPRREPMRRSVPVPGEDRSQVFRDPINAHMADRVQSPRQPPRQPAGQGRVLDVDVEGAMNAIHSISQNASRYC